MENRRITNDQIESYCRYLIDEEKSAATIRKYLRDVRSFMNFASGMPLTKEVTISFKKNLQDRHYTVMSVNSILAGINSFLTFVGWTDCKVRALKMQKKTYSEEGRELTKADYLRLLEAARGKPQLSLVMQTICSTGIRVSELQYFTVEEVKRGEIVIQCKGKTRTILMPGKLQKKLLEYARKEGISEGPVFLGSGGQVLDRRRVWDQMKKLCKQAGVAPEKVFPHNLRKLFARTFYGIEKDIAKLADILGHSSINTTRIYIMGTGTEHRRKIEKLGLLI